MKFFRKFLTVFTILVSFGLYQFAAPELNAQVYKISADQPSGGTSGQTENSGNEGLYIGIGLAAAAIIGYVLYKKFSKPDEKDSTSSSAAAIQKLMNVEKNSFTNTINNFNEMIPVDLYFGIKNQGITIPDRTYSFGIAYRF